MLSKIKVDLDYDNKPIIIINFKSSDDVRDKMVGKFLSNIYAQNPEECNYTTGLCHAITQSMSIDGAEVIIRGLSLDELTKDSIIGFVSNARKFSDEIKQKSE